MPWPWSKRGKCKHVFSYDGIKISFSGLQTPDQLFNFKIGSFKIKKELLQAASDVAQLYDLYQFSNCQRIQQLSENSSQKDTFIIEVQQNETRLAELLAILDLASVRSPEEIERELANWIAFTFRKRIREEAPIITEKVKATGRVVREAPPAEQLNKIKRSIAKAKLSSPYLQNALRDPKFDINNIHKLSLANK